jgi:glycosyltransferase involved in cell wall biosynthesis
MKILIIDKLAPYPPTTGSLLRVYNLLQHISRHHDVSLVCLFKPLRGEDRASAHLKTFCTRVELVARREMSKREYRLRLLRGALKGEPLRHTVIYSEEMADRIRALTENEPFDIVDIQRLCMAPYIKAITPINHCRKILTLHDVPYVQYRRIMSFQRNWRAKLRLFYLDLLFSKRTTLKYARLFDKCIVVSELDRDTLRRDGPDLNIAVVPNGVDVRGYPLLTDQSTTATLLMVGSMNYQPNVDGAIFFCQQVFPLIKRQVPDAKLLIVGRDPSSTVQALASDDVTVTGSVESVIPYYQQALVSVVPLRAGGGTRLKILESMALGRSVVSTTLGCEGLAVTHGENILIADSPTDFAAQTIRLLDDEELRQHLIVNGRRLVETTYDWQAITQQLLQVYNKTVSKGPPLTCR